MPVISADRLNQICFDCFETLGVSPKRARLVSDHIVCNCLHGHDTHGAILIVRFVDDLESGKIAPDAQTEIVNTGPCTARADGHRGFGPLTMTDVMEAAIAMTRDSGIAAISVTNTNHIGILWGYLKTVTDAGMIGMLWCGAGPQGGFVAPPGGKKRALGTNPLGIAIPAGDMQPFVLDISTAICAASRIKGFRREGERVPEGWIIDDDGNPTTDPEDFRETDKVIKGALLHMAGHKGFGLAVATELLTHVMSGYGSVYKPDFKEGNSAFVVTVDPERFISRDIFQAEVDRVMQYLKSTPRYPDVDEILIPGEIEINTRAERQRDGIPIGDGVWSRIREVAERLEVDLPG